VLVLDANVIVEVTLERFGIQALDTLDDEQLIAPWLLWSEVPAALSAMIFRAEISRELGEAALGRLATIKVEPRHPDGLIAEAWPDHHRARMGQDI
jgi:predicted nucleic acid-binding protein